MVGRPARFHNFGTGYMLGEGEADETGNVITYYSDMEWGGENMKFKSVATTIDDDHSEFQMYVQTPDGWWKNLEIRNERAGHKH